MNVLLLRGTPSPKRIRGTFLRHEPTRRTCFYAAWRAFFAGVVLWPGRDGDEMVAEADQRLLGLD